jgi:peptide deformylase
MKIITYPNPILNQKTQDIDLSNFDIKKLTKITKQMSKLMRQRKGIGLAAPQVNLNMRICVINQKAGNLKRDIVLINPRIMAYSLETAEEEEGCLSLPKIKMNVERPKWIKVKALDLSRKQINFEARDILARVIQHEVDHLEGVLIIDK